MANGNTGLSHTKDNNGMYTVETRDILRSATKTRRTTSIFKMQMNKKPANILVKNLKRNKLNIDYFQIKEIKQNVFIIKYITLMMMFPDEELHILNLCRL